ncbi:MAG: DUF5665 domain-containing protein [Shimia sp.]
MSDRTETEAELDATLKRLLRHPAMKQMSSVRRMMFFQLLRGLAFGLGSVLGATVVVSITVFALSQINFIPIIGEWGARIAEQIQARQ